MKSYKVVVLREAQDDIRRIEAYYAEAAGEDTAIRISDAIIERIASLNKMPFRGGISKEAAGKSTQFRQLVEGVFRILYQVVGEKVRIVLIVDGRRNIPDIFALRLIDDVRSLGERSE
ncbi:MAG: type II toxin-antitoxin system RelE/ParE family toxin [Pseudomonadota bacterium]